MKFGGAQLGSLVHDNLLHCFFERAKLVVQRDHIIPPTIIAYAHLLMTPALHDFHGILRTHDAFHSLGFHIAEASGERESSDLPFQIVGA